MTASMGAPRGAGGGAWHAEAVLLARYATGAL
jgi:hypothetical protein